MSDKFDFAAEYEYASRDYSPLTRCCYATTDGIGSCAECHQAFPTLLSIEDALRELRSLLHKLNTRITNLS